jgi:osmoprotectant transport system substrate-binding protein
VNFHWKGAAMTADRPPRALEGPLAAALGRPIDVFTTDPQLASGNYTVLKDPKNVFGFQNIALVVNKKKLNVCPSLLSTVDRINKLLTTPAIIAMNKAVAIDHQQPAAVASAFLKANHVS